MDTDRKIDFFSERLEAEPREPVKILASPLVSEATRPRVALADLKNELFSETLEAEPNEALRLTV